MSSVTLRSSSPDFISHSIPQEVQMLVLSYLDVRDLSQMAAVSRLWREVASDDGLWGRFWDKYQVTDFGAGQSKKEVLQLFVIEKVCDCVTFFQNVPHTHFTHWLKGIEAQCSLRRYEEIELQAPVFLKQILSMCEQENDAMRADFFFAYLDLHLPIAPLISNPDSMFELNCKYSDSIPIYLKIASVLLNIRNNSICSLFEYCERIVQNDAQCLYWLPFPGTLQRYLIRKVTCDKNVLFIRYFTEAIFFSKGASFSELFQCPGFNPNFLLPPWINFLEFPRNHLGVVAPDKAPFLFVFIQQFFVLPMTTESLTLGFNYSSSKRREELIKFDSRRYESWDLPFGITPQEISLKQLFQDLEVLVKHPDIDLKATDSNGLTTLQLVKAMRDSYVLSNEAFNQEDLDILERAVAILKLAATDL